MPKLGLGTPNASNYYYSNMKPELQLHSQYSDEDGSDEDDVLTTAAVVDDGGFNEEKKRVKATDENPGATKKKKTDGEDEQIPAASLPPPRLNLILNMREDANFRRTIDGAIEEMKMKGVEYNAVVEKELGKSIMKKLQKEYRIIDANGASVDDVVALKKIRTCLWNKNNYLKKSDKQPCKSLPKIFLSMKKDRNYSRIMTAAFHRFDGEEYNGTVEDMGIEVLQKLKQEYEILDKNGSSISEEDALQTLIQCLKNQHYRQPSNATATAPPAVATVNTLDFRTSSSDVYLDMRVDKNYERTVNTYVKNGYADELETGKAILRELQRSPSVKFHKRTSNGFVVVDSVGALEKICQCLAAKSRNQQILDNSDYSSPRHQNRSHESGRAQSQSQEVQSGVQRLTRDNLSEEQRSDLLNYFGRSIIVDYLSKSDSCRWTFKEVRKGHNDQWLALKNGYNQKNAQEGETKMTGVRKIAHWAFREGYFETYLNDAYGRNLLEQKGLCAESYKIIFDQEAEERSGSVAVSRRTVSPNSSPREENRASTVSFQLRGEERSEYMEIYAEVASKLGAATSASDENGKQFFGILQKCLQTKMIYTEQWHSKKDVLAALQEGFEDANQKAAATRALGDPWLEEMVIPSIIEESKEKLLGD